MVDCLINLGSVVVRRLSCDAATLPPPHLPPFIFFFLRASASCRPHALLMLSRLVLGAQRSPRYMTRTEVERMLDALRHVPLCCAPHNSCDAVQSGQEHSFAFAALRRPLGEKAALSTLRDADDAGGYAGLALRWHCAMRLRSHPRASSRVGALWEHRWTPRHGIFARVAPPHVRRPPFAMSS